MEPDHKALVLGLLGSTYGELKKLDDSITSTSSTLGRRSEEVKQELQKAVALNFAPPPQPPQMPVNVQPPAPVVQMPQPVQIPQPVYIQPPQQPPSNQLEFDFDRKARYVEVVDALQALQEKVEDLERKIDQLLAMKQEAQPRASREKKKKEPGILG